MSTFEKYYKKEHGKKFGSYLTDSRKLKTLQLGNMYRQ